jgi:tetratricopeptide (TPR) repeat protein
VPSIHDLVRAAFLSTKAIAIGGHHDRESLNSALDLFRSSASALPHSLTYMNIAETLRELGDTAGSIAALEQALALSANLQYHVRIIIELIQARRYLEAVKWGMDAVDYHSSSGVAYAIRAYAIIALLASDSAQAPELAPVCASDIAFSYRFIDSDPLIRDLQPLFKAFMTGFQPPTG